MPREHGSWAVLIAPILAGLIAAGGGRATPVALLCLAALAAFLFRPALQAFLSGPRSARAIARPAALGVLAAACGAALVFKDRLWRLTAFAAAAALMMGLSLYLARKRRAMSWENEVAGILVLSLGAPAAFYAARGTLPFAAWAAWAVCALYFVGPVFFVKLAVLQHRAAANPADTAALERMRRAGTAYHAGALSAVSAAAWAGWLTPLAAVPFAAALHKMWRRGLRGPGKTDFKRLGWAEVGYSCVFVLALAAGRFF
ncbi:MAG TPA: YwiC-like family protein [Elusimicrobiota bacterium]|nr:YwiC-like family protein [Elusimicrobiota bacterium]